MRGLVVGLVFTASGRHPSDNLGDIFLGREISP